MRSKRYPEFYKVGTVAGVGVVYWHPQVGLAIERNQWWLTEVKESERDRIAWFDDPGSLGTLEDDVRVNAELRDAMPDDLAAAYEDAVFGEEVAREKDAGPELANMGLIRGWW